MLMIQLKILSLGKNFVSITAKKLLLTPYVTMELSQTINTII